MNQLKLKLTGGKMNNKFPKQVEKAIKIIPEVPTGKFSRKKFKKSHYGCYFFGS